MLNNNIYYHGIIRKSIVAFGSLFSNIYIDRKKDGSVDGTTVQRLQIPIAYAPKEKWLVRIEQDTTLQNHTYTTLPRMSFEIIDYAYDPARKTNRMQHIKSSNNSVYSPVPYNVSVSLYILTKTQEDALQILEQILPTFTPDYNLTLDLVPDMGISVDVPIILNSVQVQDEYEGDFQTRRFVTHTLNFEMKLSLFGPIKDGKIITHTLTDLKNMNGVMIANHEAIGDIETGNITTDQWTEEF
jgi:hypothetical protein